MKYFVESYAPYFSDPGLFEKFWQGLNFLFVDAPFTVLRLFTSFFLFCEDLLNQSDFFVKKQAEAYVNSLDILRKLGGTGIAKNSILALLFLVSAYYLIYHFLISRKNFSKILLHYLGVIMIFGFWFGNVGGQSGANFLISSVSNVFGAVEEKVSQATSSFTGQKDSSNALFNATVQQTYYYVNTGSLDGTMENGKKLDDKKMLMTTDLIDEGQRKEFRKERTKYIKDIGEDNPYFKPDGSKMIEKFIAILVGIANLGVTGVPVLYMNILLTVIQIVVMLLIIMFPVIVVCSFIPKCQTVMFKFLKMIVGLLFFPVLLGFFISIYFWINSLIDNVFMSGISNINNELLAALTSGVSVLGSVVANVVVKAVLLRMFWKKRYDILGYFSDNQIEMPAIEKNIDSKLDSFRNEMIRAMTTISTQKYAFAQAFDSADYDVEEDRVGRDKASIMEREHFVEENQNKDNANNSDNPNLNEDREMNIGNENSKLLESEGFESSIDDDYETVEGDIIENESSDFEDDDLVDKSFEGDGNEFEFDDGLNVNVDNLDEISLGDEQQFFDNKENEELLSYYDGREIEINDISFDDSLEKEYLNEYFEEQEMDSE